MSDRSSLLNRAEVRRRLIQCAQDTRYYWQSIEPRVSASRLDEAEALLDAWIRRTVQGLPSKGRTI
jgi:hypothetical protein